MIRKLINKIRTIDRRELKDGELPPVTLVFDDNGEMTAESTHENAIRFIYYDLENTLHLMYARGIFDDNTEALLGEIHEAILTLEAYIRDEL